VQFRHCATMPDNASAADSAKSEHHFLGKHRWRGKLFSNEAKIVQSDELQGPQGNDLVEFLQTPTKRKVSIQHQGTTPKLEDDVSTTSRLPLVPAVDNAGLQSTSHPRRKPPRRKGLRVNFDSARPVIIGEGGDEAELPSIDVRNSLLPRSPWQQPPGQDVPHYPRRASPGVDNAPNIRWSLRQGLQNESTDNDASFRPPPLRRQSTGFHSLEPEDEIHSLDRGLQREDACTELLDKPHSMSSPASDSNSESFAAIYVSHNQVTPLSPEIVVEQSGPRLEKECLAHEDDAEDLNAFSSLKPSSPEFEAFVGNSLTPIPSPQPTTTQAALSLSYNFPSPASEQRTPSHVEAVTPQYQGTSINDVSKANAESRSPTRPPLKSPPVSLRNVAKSLGEDAFNAFLMRVQRFNAIFRLGAAANKSFANVPFAQWIRAGTWWFLKGRGELESAVRGRPSSSDSFQHSSKGDLPTGLKQAYLNLAKACWILMEVVPSHEELKKYGNVGIAALSPIVRNFGDSKLADMLEVYHAVVSNMRALTMSMKRNSKLPPDDFEPQGLNSRIWVETPRFASGVASILAGISSRNILDEGSAGFDSFPYPVGDTPRHFNYGNIFVDVVLSSSDVTQGSLQLPCILTILRQRTDRELEVVLASQDGHITLTVQSDRRAGPTWRDAHWKTNRFSILLKLADGLELDIQFQEQSFRSLWGIYDYTRRVRKQTESGEAEEVLFDTTVRCVHYVDSPDAKLFPLDPVRSCDILLMEKTLTIAEGTGRRRVHDGHRLVVVTPPSSKTLSSINHSLGKETPILFTYVRGEKDGPALLLRNEAAGSTLVITFNDPSSRDFFHTLLNGTLLKVDEFCTRSLPLRSMRIDTLEGESPIGRGNHLSDWHWQDLRVINRKPEHFEDGLPKTVLSENLRIWAQCDAGTFVDRINLGITFQFSFSSAGLMDGRPRRAADEPLCQQANGNDATPSPTTGYDDLLC